MIRRTRLLPCGKRYASELEARTSPRGREPGATVHRCWLRDCEDGWHVRPAPAPARAVPPPPRVTGFPPQVRRAIRARAGGGVIEAACCENCGKWLGRAGGEIQHRVARGMGGSRSPVVNGTANGGLLCGNRYEGCHGACEDRNPEMRERGWRIPGGNSPEHDPRLVPVTLHDGRRVWLGGDGTYLDTAPGGTVAA